MASLFGLPVEVISNLSDSSEHLGPGETLHEKMVFVGGRYQEKHDDIFRLFHVNISDSTKVSSQGYVMWRLFVVILSTIIIFCQVGFALLYSGASRKSSVVTPFVVNAMNLVISVVAFWAVGYAVARSDGLMAVGYNDWLLHDNGSSVSIEWYLYFSLALTTVNIASSGGLERCPLWITVLISAILSGAVYPFVIRWAWHYSGWMLKYTLGLGIQVQDIGGSGAVHAVGGAAALVVNLVIGPRDDKVQRKGSRTLIYDVEGHSVPLEALGSYIVLICILCTNMVRSLSAYLGTDPTASVGRGLMNSLIASAFSCLVVISLSSVLKRLLGVWRFHWLPCRMVMNSILMGAVSVSGGCTLFSQWTCAVIGVLAGIGYMIWIGAFGFTKVDDVTGSVTVHLGGGILGAISVAVFRDGTGLIFTENTELAGMNVVWNLVCVLAMVGLTMILVGAVMIVPSMIGSIPLSRTQLLQGLDYHLLKQEGYPNGHTITMYNTDAIEDRETFSDGHTATPSSQQAFANQFGYAQSYENEQMFPEAEGYSYQDCPPNQLTYTPSSTVPDVYRDLPGQRDLTFQDTSRDMYPAGDRHVWFGGDTPDPEVTLTPLITDHMGQRLQYC